VDQNKTTALLKLHKRLFSVLRLNSMKGKIFMLFALSLLSITILTGFTFWNLSALKTRLVLSERYDDLLHNILEVRRYEKNFLIYGDHQSLIEGMAYLDKIDSLVDGLTTDLQTLIGKESFSVFQETISKYRGLMTEITQGNKVEPDTLRNVGKSLTTSADQFRTIKRQRIHSAIERTSLFPIAFLCIFLPLMALVLWLVSYGLVRPLNVITKTTQLVGRGNFRPINYQGGVRLEEVSGLIDAFNRMAKELEANQENLIQARKIAALGTFTAGIAHELNNPINNIVLTAESIVEEYGEVMDDNSQEMMEDILGQAERAADIVKNLLDFSRTENPAFTEIPAKYLLDSSIKLVWNHMKMEEIKLETTEAKNLPNIIGNLGNLQQVFTNLLLNAVQAVPKGGWIHISVNPSERKDFIEFTIEDNGPGIPKEQLHKVFEPFYSTKEVGKGTGLGLSVSYSIVKRHKGTIRVFSEEGQGTVFTVTLPTVTK